MSLPSSCFKWALDILISKLVVVKNPADFLGNWLGQSENKTKSILASTIGKVLVIDEAYMLYPNSGVGQETDVYKIGVIDTLVAEVQSTPGEDRCVLLLGYEDQVCTVTFMHRVKRNLGLKQDWLLRSKSCSKTPTPASPEGLLLKTPLNSKISPILNSARSWN